MTSLDNYCKYGARPATSFVIGCAATQVLCPSVANMDVVIKGMPVPVWLLGGAASALGTLIGQITTDYVSPQITTVSLIANPAHTALNVGIGTAGSALAYSLAAGSNWSDEVSLVSLFGVAAISEVGSSYLTENWIRPAASQYMQ